MKNNIAITIKPLDISEMECNETLESPKDPITLIEIPLNDSTQTIQDSVNHSLSNTSNSTSVNLDQLVQSSTTQINLVTLHTFIGNQPYALLPQLPAPLQTNLGLGVCYSKNNAKEDKVNKSKVSSTFLDGDSSVINQMSILQQVEKEFNYKINHGPFDYENIRGAIKLYNQLKSSNKCVKSVGR